MKDQVIAVFSDVTDFHCLNFPVHIHTPASTINKAQN